MPIHQPSAFPFIFQELTRNANRKVELPSQQNLQPSYAQWYDHSGAGGTITWCDHPGLYPWPICLDRETTTNSRSANKPKSRFLLGSFLTSEKMLTIRGIRAWQNVTIHDISFLKDRCYWKRDVAKKSLDFQNTRHRIPVPLAVGTNLHKKKF